MSGKYKVEQIYYSYWGTESKEHKDYFDIIDMIARWIGYALISPRHIYLGELVLGSNIKVLQVKEKFGSPRIYVEFGEESLLEDVWYYREVYKEAIQLWPQYELAIREGMDYEEYLFETMEEIDAFIQERLLWPIKAKEDGVIDDKVYVERIEAIMKDKNFLKKVCNLA